MTNASDVRFLLMLLAVLLVMTGVTLCWSRCSIDSWRGGVVLLCRGADPIRVWPLPPVQPWWERNERRGESREARVKLKTLG